jgi:hypothetical protein
MTARCHPRCICRNTNPPAEYSRSITLNLTYLRDDG